MTSPLREDLLTGTIIIDLVTHKPSDILPTRESSDVTAWLKRYPDIKVVSRDGSKSHAKVIKDASPDIKQVGDRWHILKQLCETVKQTIRTFLPKKWVPPQKYELNDEPKKSLRENRIRLGFITRRNIGTVSNLSII